MAAFYAMYYTGAVGSGHAVFIMDGGTITGADAVGGMLDGTYSEEVDGNLVVSVELTVPAGTQLVTGAIAGNETFTQRIDTILPPGFANGQANRVETPTGPVNVIFRHLRTVK